MSIVLTREHAELNIGGLLLELKDEIKMKKWNHASLRVANHFWYGTFRIPSAAGFSTPISICINEGENASELCLSVDKDWPENYLLDALSEWSKTYRGHPVRKDHVLSFTSSNQTCFICTEDYKLGDKLIQLAGCNHQVHYTCMNKWRTAGKSAKDILIARIMEERMTAKCPVCTKETS